MHRSGHLECVYSVKARVPPPTDLDITPIIILVIIIAIIIIIIIIAIIIIIILIELAHSKTILDNTVEIEAFQVK